MRRLIFTVAFLLALAATGYARTLTVADDESLQAALPGLRPGDTLRLQPGRYRSGLRVQTLQGTADQPIVIEGADPDDPPLFEGGRQAAQFSACAHLTVRHLRIRGQSINGLNLDDGGNAGQAARHIVLEHLHVSEIGPRGNHDALKLSGLADFVVRHCTIDGWGGQAIDMVGCHRGIVEQCTFLGREGYSLASGVQTKGGSSEITIRHNRFEKAGGRPMNLGGSTGAPYFRPPGANYEARSIHAHDNLIIGGMAAVAFTGLDGGTFHHNTIVNPGKWVFRILQETTTEGFPPCRKVEFHHNLIVFQRSAVRGVANIGGGTDPGSFTFHHNWWYATDAPARSKPTLPARETDGIHGRDPKLDRETHRPGAGAALSFGRRLPDARRP